MKALTFAGVALAALLAGAGLAFGEDPGLLLGRQSGEFHAGDQHHRHQLRRGPAGLQSPDRIQARHD